MDILPSNVGAPPVAALGAIAGDAVADLVEAPELLDVDMDELAGMLALVAMYRLGRLGPFILLMPSRLSTRLTVAAEVPMVMATSTLKAAGYVREHHVTNQSWDEKIARELASTRGVPLTGTFREVPWHETWRKREERVEVYHRPMPSGPYVSGVDYGMGNAAMTEEAFRAAVRARYGAQSAAGSSEMIFCSVGEAACSVLDFQNPKQLPYIIVRPFGGAER